MLGVKTLDSSFSLHPVLALARFGGRFHTVAYTDTLLEIS